MVDTLTHGSSTPRYQQNVTASGGFAYGVVCGDIQIHRGGQPLYLLAEWLPEPVADAAWLREMPSRMLNAHRAVVPFTGRDDDLADLRAWRDTDRRLSVRWLHGPGGQGKSRLAAQFAAECAVDGWKAVSAFHGQDADRPEPGSQNLDLTERRGLLVVVDYADRWQLDNLTWFFKDRSLHWADKPARILMIARSLDAWTPICAVLDTYRAETSSRRLPHLPDGPGRGGLFRAARDRFAALYSTGPGGVAIDPQSIKVPADLSRPDFGLTLAVLMSALVSVDAAVHGGLPPEGMDSLTRYVLNRERLHWGRLYHDGMVGTGSSYTTPAPLMEQTTFVASLTGVQDRGRGEDLLTRLGIGPESDKILTDHAVCYPPPDLPRGAVLEPLYPDRLAEDFIALTVPIQGHPVISDYASKSWAPQHVAELFRSAAPWTARGITVLAAAAERWPHLAEELNRVLYARPALAVLAGNAALSTLARLVGVDLATLIAIADCFPTRRRLDLDIGIAAIAARLAPHRLDTTRDPVACARILDDLSLRHANAGSWEAAQQAAERACELWSEPARLRADYRPHLAQALTNLARRHWELGNWGESFDASERAVAIWRKLAAADPRQHRAGLAEALNSLGVDLARANRAQEALTVTTEAVEIRRGLVLDEGDEYLEFLAQSLGNLSACMYDEGRVDAALALSGESVEVWRLLHGHDPNAYQHEYASALANLGYYEALLKQTEQSLRHTRQAVELLRPLTRINPSAHEPDLAFALKNLTCRLWETGRYGESLSVSEEAVALFRRLTETNRAPHEPELAYVLSDLTVALTRAGRDAAARDAGAESVEIFRRLAKDDPSQHRPEFARALSNFGEDLATAGERQEALAVTQQAESIIREVVKESPPDLYNQDLLEVLVNLALRLREAGQPHDAIAVDCEVDGLQQRVTYESAHDKPAK